MFSQKRRVPDKDCEVRNVPTKVQCEVPHLLFLAGGGPAVKCRDTGSVMHELGESELIQRKNVPEE